MTTAQIVVGTSKANELQEEIQKKLVANGYATEGDTVMAEFVLVMLANQKTPSQITAELTDLIGPEYEGNFTDWLFRTVAELYAPPPIARPQRIETVDDTSAERDRRPRHSGGPPRGAGSGGLRNSRVTPYNPMARNQARDFDVTPLAGGRGDDDGAPPNAPRGPRSIFDRVDLQQGRAAHVPISRMQGNGSPHQVNYAIQQQMGGAFGGGGFQHGGAFNPRVAPAPQFYAPPPFAGPPKHHQQRPPAPTPPVPGRPTSDTLCKFGVECKNAWCGNSHPSPVATAESGLVLTTDPCEKQLFCNDPDCPKAHISQQARNPALSMAPPARAPTPSFGGAAGGMDVDGAPSKSIPCRYGNACTRPGCFYSHPWETKGSATVCKFGEGCTKPECHFKHPAGRAIDRKTSKNKTATFVNGLSNSQSSNGMAHPETSDSQMSERLKRFAQPADGPVERILPGGDGVAKDETAPMEA